MRTLLKCFVCLILFAGGSVTGLAQTATYEKDVKTMMELAKTKELAINTMAQTWKAMNIDIPNPEKLASIIVNDFWDDYVKECAKVYSKYYTLEDLKAIIAFYKTPAGKKMAESNTPIMEETSKIVSTKYNDRIQSIVIDYLSN